MNAAEINAAITDVPFIKFPVVVINGQQALLQRDHQLPGETHRIVSFANGDVRLTEITQFERIEGIEPEAWRHLKEAARQEERHQVRDLTVAGYCSSVF